MNNEFLRHVIATINYRFQTSVKDTEDSFGYFTLEKGSRSPNEIIHHMHSVLYAARIFIKEERFNKVFHKKLNLTQEIERFNSEMKKIDEVLANAELGIEYSKKLLQGPFSDILTHIGQITMLRRIFGEPVKGEDFSSASIQTGLN